MMNSFFPSMQAAAVAQMNATAMVGTAKLANSKDSKETNSSLVVRSSVPKFNVAGGLYTVSQWARKCVEDNLEWIVKLCRRRAPNANAVMLSYGDGCQTLVLLDAAMNQMPAELNTVQKIGIGVSTAPIDDKSDEKKMAAAGVLQPTDSIWDHLRYEQTDASKDKVEKVMFIHTCTTNYGDGIDGRRRVLQVKTGAPQKPYSPIAYVPNVVFEQQVLARWKGPGPAVPNMAAMNMASFLVPPMVEGGMMSHSLSAAAMAATAPPEEGETVITFNPKELILLEKAFDNHLTNRDLKSKADKWSEDDKKACQLVIKRANAEFKWVASKKRKKNDGAALKTIAAKKKKAEPAPTKKDAIAAAPKKKDDPALKKKDTTAAKPSATAVSKKEGKKDEDKSSSKKVAVTGKEKTPSKIGAPKKAESGKKKDKDVKEKTVAKTPVNKIPSKEAKADALEESKSASKKKKRSKQSKTKDEAVDSDDEPISKLKEPPAAEQQSKSPPKSPKSSAKKHHKKDEASQKKRGRSNDSRNKEDAKHAKKSRSKSTSKK